MTLCLAIKAEEYNMNLKKVTQKNADGSSISYEFDVPKMQGVPDHPGEPKGPDTVPAWLTPGEFVVNAEATRMFEPQIEAMNNAGRAVQRQQGGTIPEYKADGGVVDNSVERYDIPSDYKGNVGDAIYNAMSNPSQESYTYKPGQTEDRNQNIYNFAYEGRLGLDTVPNATPFDKSIIMQAMNDAQGNSEVPMDTSVPEPTTPGYVPQYGVNRDPKYAETIKQYAPTGDEFSLSDVYDSFIKPKDVEQMDIPTVTTEEFINDSQSPGDVPMELSGINPSDLLSQQRANQGIVIDEFGVGVLPGEGSRSSTAFTPPKNLAELTGGVVGFSEDVETVRNSKQNEAIANSVLEVVNDKDAAKEAAKIKEEEAIKAGLDYIENIENIKSGKGPSNGDTGDIYTDSFLDKAEGLLSSVGSFFKDNFSTLLDDDKLKNAALLYLGSRAMGYSHAGSLNFVGKRYMGQIESKLKTADEAALTGKYSKESISKYRDTGNPSDLVMNKAFSIVGTKDMVDPKTGKTVAVTTYKDDNTGKLIHQSVDGKPIPNIGSLRTQADEDAKFNNFKRTIVSNIQGELKRIPDEEARANISSAIPNPQGFAGEAYEVARKLGLDTAKINSLVPSMIREMIRDTKSGITINETAVQSYFNKQLINLSLKEYEVKANLNNANTQELSKINAMIPNSSNPVVLSTFWRGAGEEFGKLSDKEKKFYSGRADEELGITPIMVFVKEELSELSK